MNVPNVAAIAGMLQDTLTNKEDLDDSIISCIKLLMSLVVVFRVYRGIR